CNEVMLLPYYIAAMNIEHEYMTLTGDYTPFDGICLMDTFQLAEPAEQAQLAFMTAENATRVDQQKQAPIFVILGNPPYNVGQVNENDNNKNRKYPAMDKRVRETYAQDSKATNKNALSDVYVKAIRWASDRIGDEGIVAFITNSGFVDGVAFDGMRKHLAQDFNRIYILDLKGNVRKDSMREGIPIGEEHTIFGLAAMVGISVSFLIKNQKYDDYKIYYSTVDWKTKRKEKFELLEQSKTISLLEWEEIISDKKHNWLIKGMGIEFETFIPIGTKEAKSSKKQNVEAIFKLFSNGNDSGRDSWVYNFSHDEVLKNAKLFTETYNSEVDRWFREGQPDNIDEFVISDEKCIKWTRNAKRDLKRRRYADFSSDKVRKSLYRPFITQYLYSGKIFNKEVALLPRIFPTPDIETENWMICLTDKGSEKPFMVLVTNQLVDLHLVSPGCGTQCFPFYTYDKDGSNRRENITDWALEQFRAQYYDDTITKWDIFHYVYGILHHPQYREKYTANLKRELPRIPFIGVPKLCFGESKQSFNTPAEVFREFARAG
ncbi:MAG: DNA helicase, partial [Deltaproteobacteria bacterium]|nr:DNA helicase [Deltaproteobacteria bacterium]